QSRSFVAVNIHIQLQLLQLQIAGHILHQLLHLRRGSELLLEFWSNGVKLLRVRALQCELILALGELASNADRWQYLREGVDPGYLRQLRPQLLDQFPDRRALVSRRQPDKDASNVAARHRGKE